MNYLTRPVRLFRFGVDYADKGIDARPPAFAERLLAASRSREPQPLQLTHAPTEQVLDIGHLLPETFRREGEWAWADAQIAEPVFASLKTREVSVSLDRATGAVTSLSIVPDPRVEGAAIFHTGSDEVGTVTFHEGEIMSEPLTSAAGAPPEGGGDRGYLRGALDTLLAVFSRERVQAAPEPAPTEATFSAADFDAKVKAAVEAATAPLVARVEAAEAKAATFSADTSEARVAALEARRVPPYWARAAVALQARGGETVAFSADGKDVTDAQLGEAIVAHFTGATPQGGLPRANDNRAEFADEQNKRHELAAKVAQFAREHNVGQAEAFAAVTKEA